MRPGGSPRELILAGMEKVLTQSCPPVSSVLRQGRLTTPPLPCRKGIESRDSIAHVDFALPERLSEKEQHFTFISEVGINELSVFCSRRDLLV